MLGDPIKLKIKIQVPADSKLQNIDLNIHKNIQNLDYAKVNTMSNEKYADLEILDFGVWNTITVGSVDDTGCKSAKKPRGQARKYNYRSHIQ